MAWYGVTYTFSPKRRGAVEALWRDWEQGGSGLAQAYLLERAGSSGGSLRDLFKIKGVRQHPAWGTLIVASDGARDVFRLAFPGAG